MSANTINDGGPAYPYTEANGCNCGGPGMSMRDYFIAHAPAEPQPWFEPVIGAPCPVFEERPYPKPPSDMTDAEQEEFAALDSFSLSESDLKQRRVIEYVKAESAEQERREFKVGLIFALEKEQKRQRYIQWPAAWADAMLEQRAKGGAA